MKYDYKELIKEFCDDKCYGKIQRSHIQKEELYKLDLFDGDPMTVYEAVISVMCKESSKYLYVKENRNYLRDFYDWSITKGYISQNPFDQYEMLNQANMMVYAAENAKVVFLDEEKIEYILQRDEENRKVHEFVLRSFFEGISSYKQLLGIRLSDIDYETCSVLLDGKPRKFSDKYFKVIREFKDTCWYMGAQKNPRELVRFEDYLFTFSAYKSKETLEEYYDCATKNLRKYFKKIGEIIGDKIDYQDLYVSGFIEFAREKYKDISDDRFCSIFLNNGAGKYEDLKDFRNLMKEYGVCKPETPFRQDAAIYLMKSRYYH